MIHRSHSLSSERLLFLALVLLTAGVFAGPERAGFQLLVRNIPTPFKITPVFLLPGESFSVEAYNPNDTGLIPVQASPVNILKSGLEIEKNEWNDWSFKGPSQPGTRYVTFSGASKDDTLTLAVFTMVPKTRMQGEFLNGYRIGFFPALTAQDPAVYGAPPGFVEITPANRQHKVSPHFSLDQFQSPQTSGYPQYIVLTTRLIIKLEYILEAVNARGRPCSTLTILEGYRTPCFNDSIGGARYSRHIWGDAATFIVDQDPADGMIDDLNNDGTHDVRDADLLYQIIDGLYHQPWYKNLEGGLAAYRFDKGGTPAVHIDARGVPARWGH